MRLEKIEKYLPPIVTLFLKKMNAWPRTGTKARKTVKISTKAQTPSKTQTTRTFGGGRFAVAGLAMVLVGMGQFEMIQTGENKTLWFGLALFAIAIGIFLRAFAPWRREQLREDLLPPKIEWGLFALIMVIGAFFRLYRLDFSPNGVFMDQGFEGYGALKILHEGWRPFYEVEEFQNPALLLYQLAGWFVFFKPTQVALYTFFALFGLAAFPLIYWTFRQLAGPRPALLTLFILAVMRWHVNFSRNGFPTIEVPFYMFGTLAFLLYGLRRDKRWPFVVSAVFLSLGYYTYNSFKVFPLLVFLYGAYEFVADKERIRRNAKSIWVFIAIFVVMTLPLTGKIIQARSFGAREASNTILTDVKREHSLKPLLSMIGKTALMFNRQGDDNERHNLPNHRMLDDVTGCLFVLGLGYAAARFFRRKYFFAISGLLIMTLPCVLSVVPAHANRMLGVTPFVCFLVAAPLSAFWGRVRRQWGGPGEWVLLLLLMEPLFLIAYLNYDMYFNQQATSNVYWSTGYWSGYSIDATVLGKKIAECGGDYDYLIPQRYADHKTVKYFTYGEKDDIQTFTTPEGYAPLKSRPGKGLCYAFMEEQLGMVELVKHLYPTATVEPFKDKDGHAFMEFVQVPADKVAQAEGLRAEFSDGTQKEMSQFPKDLPPGPYQVKLKGCLFIDTGGDYEFQVRAKGKSKVKVAGVLVAPGQKLSLAKGFYSVEIDWDAPAGPAAIQLVAATAHGTVTFDSSRLTSLPLNRGLRASYYEPNDFSGTPALVEWDPMVNFVNGTDFPYVNYNMSAKWEGEIEAPKAGEYDFAVQTDEVASVKIDGETVCPTKIKSGSVRLTAGSHKIQVYFQKVLGPSLSLFWRTPGTPKMTVVPNEVFGETRPLF